MNNGRYGEVLISRLVHKRSQKLLRDWFFTVAQKISGEFHLGLGARIIHSPFSIVLNAAEGSGRASDVELGGIDIALGSANETLAAAGVLRYNGFMAERGYAEAEESEYRKRIETTGRI